MSVGFELEINPFVSRSVASARPALKNRKYFYTASADRFESDCAVRRPFMMG
jgi:hypothetical protein